MRQVQASFIRAGAIVQGVGRDPQRLKGQGAGVVALAPDTPGDPLAMAFAGPRSEQAQRVARREPEVEACREVRSP